MRMLQPSPGECMDRVSILELKIAYAATKNMECQYLIEEKESIIDYLTPKTSILADDKKEVYIDTCIVLARTNSQLWKLEDEIRLYVNDASKIDSSKDRIVEIALLIPVLNDQRAEAVRLISDIVVGKVVGQEKFYA